MKKNICFCLFSFFCFFQTIHSNEPIVLSNDFIKSKGEFSSIFEYSTYKTDHFWNKHGKKKAAHNDLKQKDFHLFIEYGLNNKNTIGLYTNFVRNREYLHWTLEGFGDTEICWKRYWINWKQWEISSRLLGIIPSGEKKTSVRYGRFGAELDLHVQRNFLLAKRSGWCEFLAGYRYYNGFASDQIKFTAIAGYQLFSRLRLVGSTYLNYGLFNRHERFKGPILTLSPSYRLLKMKFHLVFTVTKHSEVFVGYTQHVWGQNIGTGNGIYTGLWIGF